MSGATLLATPTIMYGGATLLSVLTDGTAGISPGGLTLDDRQWALWRAGHAHAGVWVVLSLVLQVLLDSAKLSREMSWVARIAAPLGAIAVSGGFFGLAYFPVFRWLLYLGALSLLVSLITTGIGLLRGWRSVPGLER
jgi:hypothetical protein